MLYELCRTAARYAIGPGCRARAIGSIPLAHRAVSNYAAGRFLFNGADKTLSVPKIVPATQRLVRLPDLLVAVTQ